jgi:hypothetical protein
VSRELGFEAVAAPEIEDGPEGLVVRFGDRELLIGPDEIASLREGPPAVQ